jgi:hypothetical protein
MLIFRLAGVLIIASGLARPVDAGDIYKWKDKDGIQHFSSTPPEAGESFATIEVPVEPEALVTMRKTGTNHEPEYVFINDTWAPVEIELTLPESENVLTEPPLPAQLVLPPRTERQLLKIKARDPGLALSYRLAYKTMLGPPVSRLPAEVDYYPPFPAGMDFIISQGFDNDQTHNNPPNQYAIDIVMPVGTPVLAARGGRVIAMEGGFNGAGQSNRFLARSNRVRILHDDGTMSVYAHLQANSLRVKPGTVVSTGQWIASSGNTGYSSGPHLHFVIQLNAGMALESLPFRFHKPSGGTMTPGKQTTISGVLSL